MAHAAQMLTQEPIFQVFLVFCFKPILLSAHKLILLIYGDNTCPPGFGNDSSKTNQSLHLPVNAH